MLFFSMPKLTDEKLYDDNQMQSLRNMLVEQLNDLSLLCTIVENLDGFIGHGIDLADAQKYKAQIKALENNQQKRFAKIDEYIIENIIAIQKEKTADKTIINSGKEVRKLEAGLRTLKLFTMDIISMLEPNSKIMDRSNERLYYFKKRSVALEGEIKELQEKLASL